MNSSVTQRNLSIVFSILALVISSVTLYVISGAEYHRQAVKAWVAKNSFEHKVSSVTVVIEPVSSAANLVQDYLGLEVEYQVDGQYQQWFYANGEPVKKGDSMDKKESQKVFLGWNEYEVHGVKGSKNELVKLVNEKYEG